MTLRRLFGGASDFIRVTRVARGRRLLGVFMFLVGLGSARAAQAGPCVDELSVVSSQVAFATRMFQGKPLRRDAKIEVQLKSTSTTTVSRVELAVFLGASLEAVRTTRGSALPTLKARELPGGGIAFRQEVDAMIPAGATRVVTLSREAVPMDQALLGISTAVVSCRRLHAAGEATLEMPAQEDTSVTIIALFALAVLFVTVVLVLRRLR